MIYLENTTDEQRVFIPLSVKPSGSVVTFCLIHPLTGEEVFSIALPNTQNGDYLVADIELEDMESGEYNYSISAEGVNIGKGIVRLSSGGVSYETMSGNISYQEYE